MMRITELKEYVKKAYIKARENGLVPVSRLVLGAPGIGKTEMGRQLCAEIAEHFGWKAEEYSDDKEPDGKTMFYVYLNLNEVDSIDLTGLPRERDGFVVYKPLKWARVCSENPCLIHLDEITSVRDDRVLSSAMKIICERMVGYVKLSDDCLIIATGNTPDTNSMAGELPAPFVNKVSRHMVEAPSVDEWARYMNTVFGDRWDKRIYGILAKYPEIFVQKPEDSDTLEPYATPRSWTNLAKELYLTGGEKVEEIVYGFVGRDTAAKVVTALKRQIDVEKYYNNLELLRNEDISVKYFVVSWMAANEKRVTPEKYKKLYEVDEEMAMLLLTIMPRDTRRKLVMQLLKDRSTKSLIEELMRVSKIKEEIGL